MKRFATALLLFTAPSGRSSSKATAPCSSRNVAYNRYLDYDLFNVRTRQLAGTDTEWIIVAA